MFEGDYCPNCDSYIKQLEAKCAHFEATAMTAIDENAELREAARDAVDAVRFYKPEHERAAIDALAALLEKE